MRISLQKNVADSSKIGAKAAEELGSLDNTPSLCYIRIRGRGWYRGARRLKHLQPEHGVSRVKILVIDDSNTIRKTAEALLTRAGHQVVTAVDGFESLAKIADDPPDLIFVDIMMPRLDGYQTCALIKNNRRFCHIPVVMLSSKDGVFDKARGRIVGADAYLTKPFGRQDLLDAVAGVAAGDTPSGTPVGETSLSEV